MRVYHRSIVLSITRKRDYEFLISSVFIILEIL
jgi:hypothetical protein